MFGRLTASAVLIALSVGCAGVTPVGRNADRAPAPPAVTAPAPPAPQAAPRQTASPTPAPQAATPTPAPTVVAPVAAPPPQQQQASIDEGDEDAVIVPGGRDVALPPPGDDPRSAQERMRDIRAWDQCLSRASATFDDDPMAPQLDRPEDVCSQQLGMASRTAVPLSRREPRQ